MTGYRATWRDRLYWWLCCRALVRIATPAYRARTNALWRIGMSTAYHEAWEKQREADREAER